MFDGAASRKIHPLYVDIDLTTRYIQDVQKVSGEIPWSIDGKTDPWDHVENAMGLSVGGCSHDARRAYLWLANGQLSDGSWWAEYRNGMPKKDTYKDTNMTAYIAVGLLHYYMVTGDRSFVKELFPTVCKAIDFVLNHQGIDGQIYWAESPDGTVDKRALLTGSSSIFMSLTCAVRLVSIVGDNKPHWDAARTKLAQALRCYSHVFDQTKSNFSMDWYYPVLCGVLTGKAAHQRIDDQWDTFAIPDWGIRCVSERPWVTMAETSELSMALASIGRIAQAEQVLSWIKNNQYDNGAYWMGVTVPDKIIYTDEQTTWTGAAVLLAADMIYGLTPASRLFVHNYLKTHRFMYEVN
ncbi:MAG: phenyltransferase domain-containing protein [Candidatus Magnetomorum sp.]|nr:phenyltransferase domain-containing protein [Candidatus Magnetomorum sp.]